MKLPFKLFSIVFMAIVVAGCASTYVPPTAGYKAPEQSKIGVLVVAKENPSHTHVGTTIFNNFSKEYEYDWQLKENIFKIFEDKIESGTTYDVVDISNLVSESDTLTFVDVVNKRSQGGTFSRSCCPGNQNYTTLVINQLPQCFRQS